MNIQDDPLKSNILNILLIFDDIKNILKEGRTVSREIFSILFFFLEASYQKDMKVTSIF